MHARLAKPGLAARSALALIGGYQRWISPRKGYRCAHAMLNGGPGCSGFAKAAISEHGLWAGLGLLRQRFRDCRTAMHTLIAQQTEAPESDITEEELETAKRQRNARKKAGWCGGDDVAFAACETPGACCGGTSVKAAETKVGICGALGSFGAIGCCGN